MAEPSGTDSETCKTAQRSVLLRKSRPGVDAISPCERTGVRLLALRFSPAGEVRSQGYEKLKPYGFLVHGCIDGGSNFVVYATVALDKSRPTLLKEFEAVTAKFGLPQRLRSDMALEAAFAGQHMWEEHGPESYMVGRSTVNQDHHPIRPQGDKGIRTYYPVKHFTDAQLIPEGYKT
ncbi:MAG: hypothetical protein FRX49_08006 [Trebouxia sp. A1-2]|nr:MAG: hypothetical protein FRX49_08006 [Trebouxia sp. A1-2]